MLRRALTSKFLVQRMSTVSQPRVSYCTPASQIQFSHSRNFASKTVKPNYEIYKKNTDMRDVQKNLKFTTVLGAGASILAIGGFVQGNFLVAFLAGFIGVKNLINTQSQYMKSQSFVKSIELTEDLVRARFHYGFDTEFKEIEISKILQNEVRNIPSKLHPNKDRVYIQLTLEDKKLHVILDGFSCWVQNKELLRLVLAGETEDAKHEFNYGTRKENDSEFADFVKAHEDQFKKDNRD
jgi:hypothetical protein